VLKDVPAGIAVSSSVSPEGQKILSASALQFLADLHRKFNRTRLDLLQARLARQQRINAGEMPDFLPETKSIREKDWTVAPIPADLRNRKVEITGPVDRKMIINALNSGANCFMADCEDSSSPTWENVVEGQVNLRDAVRREISFTNEAGKKYALNEKTATILVRPRGWHLDEKHITVDGQLMSGSLVDFGLHFFHNAKELLSRGSGPYFYLPKLESHLEARLWNDVFAFAQKQLGVPHGSIRATVLIETILASFECDEILYELRDHSAGLNCGRWDYIFSFIKKFHANPKFVLPDRSQVTMTTPFMRAYCLNVIKICHRRGIHAMGGMAAQIPIKNDPAANDAAIAKVKADKEREATDGHDGTWVAHPGLIPTAAEQFAKLQGDNQISRQRPDVNITAADLVRVPENPQISEEGVRANIRVGVQYLEAWLRGNGCVPLYNLMEDAATAEISRAQLWQWVHHQAPLSDGRKITQALFLDLLNQEMQKLQGGKFELAARLFREMTISSDFAEFLTLAAYRNL
jgi:malate synthase